MVNEVRTPRGKLVGKLDERTGCFSIKDGRKLTLIEIPASGLRLRFSPGDSVTEEVYIPPQAKPATA
jgi:hypothetical protein